jgi:cytochrome d ubiquinol oxidase subunit I
VVALETGWIVTEVGRQPWIVHGYMRTEEAVTDAQGIWWVFALTMLIYLGLALTTAYVLRGLARRPDEEQPGGDIPYAPLDTESRGTTAGGGTPG